MNKLQRIRETIELQIRYESESKDQQIQTLSLENELISLLSREQSMKLRVELQQIDNLLKLLHRDYIKQLCALPIEFPLVELPRNPR